jgi:hypothetical protein
VRSTSIVGVAWNADNTPLPWARVRLRNVVTGKIASAAVADAAGQFTFAGVETGAYLIELVTESGKIAAVSHTFSVAPGETVARAVRMAKPIAAPPIIRATSDLLKIWIKREEGRGAYGN